MKVQSKTKAQLINELEDLRKKNKALKITEATLHESEATLNSIFRAAPTGIGLVSNRIILQANDRLCQILGYSREEIIGKDARIIYPSQEDYEYVGREKYEQIRKFGTGTVETRFKRKDGKVIDVLLSSTSFNPKNLDEGVTFTVLDITESKQAERAFRESKEKYRILIENANEAIFVAQDGFLRFFNPKTLEMSGYTIEEMAQMPFVEMIHPDDRQMVTDRYQRRLKGEALPAVYPFKIVDKKGEVKWVEISAVKIDWDGKPATLNFLSDITKRKAAEDKIKKSLAEKEVLLKEIHHRVKNNMQIISSLLRLQSRMVKDKDALEMFKAGQSRIHSMVLVHESLYKSKNLSRVDFSGYVSRMTTHLFSMYSPRVTQISLNLDVKEIFLDINRAIPCGQIINDLVSNCLKHAFEKRKSGEISVMMKIDKQNRVTLAVSDDGIGFPDGLDFRKTETLGMQLITDLVSQLNGTISLDRNGGTTFKINFLSSKDQ